MFESRIELESEEDQSSRYERVTKAAQRTYEFFYDLWEGLPYRLTAWLKDGAYDNYLETSNSQIGRKRYFKVVGSVRLPLTSIQETST